MDKVIPTNGTSAEDIKYANTVKKVYIDGVDVSECSYAITPKRQCPNKPMPYAKETSCISCKEHNTKLNFCKNNPDCYFKQLKRLEQENERLKELKCKFKEYCTCNTEKYIQTLQEIRDIVDENKDTAQYRGICLSIIAKINEVIGAE